MQFMRLTGEVQASETGIAAELSHGFRLRIDLLEDWLLRVAIVPEEGLRVDRSWMIDPSGDLPWEGRGRLSVAGFSCPEGEIGALSLGGEMLRVRVEADPLRLVIDQRSGEGWRTVVADRQGGAYQWLSTRGLFRHYQARSTATRHFGLGDKTGPLDRTGRRLRCLQTDSLGYNAETSDPLYKHAPFLIVDQPMEDGPDAAAGILYDTLCETTFDLGAEHSNYFPHYRHVETAEKGLVCYVLAGPRPRDVVPRLMRLTGLPHLPPRWSFGFAFTTMHHADHPEAQRVMTEFAERCRADGIPISAIHAGSGYTTKADGRRYVFTWNEAKFPDRAAFFARLAELGLRSCANVKPVLLNEHPDFARAAAEGWFVRRADGKPAIEMFWGGPGASLDMTRPATLAWWKKGFSDQVLGAGFSSGWNDNNEAELSDETATVDGFGEPLAAIDVRPLHALLMMRATFEATAALTPARRPYTVTRAGPIGIARYGETWTGDNHTSWHTLKWNLRQGLSMSLSGMPLVGHDIGGFDGPKPGPELLLRSVQMMALHPRAVMNSWKPQLEEPATLPWMHPEVTEAVKAALRLRYRFLPCLYHLAFKAHCDGSPVIAPLFYHFDEAACFAEQDAFMLGPDVLVAPVVAEGARAVTIHLPDVPGGWIDHATGTVHQGGRPARIEAPLERLPILVRSGAILPLALDWDDRTPHDAVHIALTLHCGTGSGEAAGEFFWDDGESVLPDPARRPLIRARAVWSETEAGVTVEPESGDIGPRLSGAVRGRPRRES